MEPRHTRSRGCKPSGGRSCLPIPVPRKDRRTRLCASADLPGSARSQVHETCRCLVALVAGIALPARAQSFVNLDFEEARLESIPPPSMVVPWEDAIPGWGHSDGDSTEFVYYSRGMPASA